MTLTQSKSRQPHGQKVPLFQFKSKGKKREEQKVLAIKYDDLGPIPGAYRWGKKTLRKVAPDLHCVDAYTYIPQCKINEYIKLIKKKIEAGTRIQCSSLKVVSHEEFAYLGGEAAVLRELIG